MDSAATTPRFKTARTLHDDNETLREENARLQAAVDIAIADAMDRDDVDLAERLTEMAEG